MFYLRSARYLQPSSDRLHWQLAVLTPLHLCLSPPQETWNAQGTCPLFSLLPVLGGVLPTPPTPFWPCPVYFTCLVCFSLSLSPFLTLSYFLFWFCVCGSVVWSHAGRTTLSYSYNDSDYQP